MKITVTGGKGFLGKHLLRKLAEKGYREVSISDLPEYNLVRLEDVQRMYDATKPDVVIHLAWSFSDDPVELLESDLTEAMNRLEALKQHLANSSVYEDFKRLEKQVEGFDTDSALKSVETIARRLDIEL